MSKHWEQFVSDYTAWAAKTFPDGTVQSAAAHLRAEAAEVIESQSPEEVADCFMLVLYMAERLGIDLLAEAQKKFAINRSRTWGPRNADGYQEHVK